MAGKDSNSEGPFGKSTPAARDGLDADTKSFLDVARLEAEGYTDEKMSKTLGNWDAARLDALESNGQGGDTDGLRRLLLGCAAALVLLMGALGVWAKTSFDAAEKDRLEIAETLSGRLDSSAEATASQFEALQGAVNQQVRSAAGATARAVSGRACGEDLDWNRYKQKDMYVEVNTTSAGFSETPIYTASVEGSGSWTTMGPHAIYSASPTSFRVYMFNHAGSDMLKYAVDKKWCITWIAIGN